MVSGNLTKELDFMKIIDKILDTLIGFGEALRGITYSNRVDIEKEINGKDSENPHFVINLRGNYSIKLTTLIAAIAAVSAMLGACCASCRCRRRKG